jgi:glutathione S-transferase
MALKLFYSSGACSLSPHIVLREAGYDFSLEKVDLKTKKTETGADFTAICDKGYVPALQLEDGTVLTEGAAIVQHLADSKPGSKLSPPVGSSERAQFVSWLVYIATELHKGFSPLFHKVNDGAVEAAKSKLLTRLDYVAKKLEGREFLVGSHFTAADAYLYTILNWCNYQNIDLAKWPSLDAYVKRIAARPAVQAALEAEGLLKKAA